MNFHPIIVHFPIACLVLYSLFECISFVHKGFREKFAFTKIVLLVIGVVFAFLALQSGEYAQELIGEMRLIELHEEYAELSYKLYIIILLLYVISRELVQAKFAHPVLRLLKKRIDKMRQFGVFATLAVVWIVLLSITGALGGAISHGPDADIIVRIVYDVLLWDK